MLWADNCTNSTNGTDAGGSSVPQLLNALTSAVEDVDCSTAAVVFTITMAASFDGVVAFGAFQQSIAAALDNGIEAEDVQIISFTQVASASAVLPGSPSSFDNSTAAGQAAQRQFLMGIASIYSGGGVTVTIVRVGSGGVQSGRRRVEEYHASSSSSSWASADEDAVHIEYEVVLSSSSAVEVAAFQQAASTLAVETLCDALNRAGSALGQLSPQMVQALPATIATNVQYSVELALESSSEAQAAADASIAVLSGSRLASLLRVESLTTEVLARATRCGAGYAAAAAGAECVECPAGKVSTGAASSGFVPCNICVAGSAPSRMRDQCVECPGILVSPDGKMCRVPTSTTMTTTSRLALGLEVQLHCRYGATQVITTVALAVLLATTICRVSNTCTGCLLTCSTDDALANLERATLKLVATTSCVFGVSATLLGILCQEPTEQMASATQTCTFGSYCASAVLATVFSFPVPRILARTSAAPVAAVKSPLGVSRPTPAKSNAWPSVGQAHTDTNVTRPLPRPPPAAPRAKTPSGRPHRRAAFVAASLSSGGTSIVVPAVPPRPALKLSGRIRGGDSHLRTVVVTDLPPPPAIASDLRHSDGGSSPTTSSAHTRRAVTPQRNQRARTFVASAPSVDARDDFDLDIHDAVFGAMNSWAGDSDEEFAPSLGWLAAAQQEVVATRPEVRTTRDHVLRGTLLSDSDSSSSSSSSSDDEREPDGGGSCQPNTCDDTPNAKPAGTNTEVRPASPVVSNRSSTHSRMPELPSVQVSGIMMETSVTPDKGIHHVSPLSYGGSWLVSLVGLATLNLRCWGTDEAALLWVGSSIGSVVATLWLGSKKIRLRFLDGNRVHNGD